MGFSLRPATVIQLDAEEGVVVSPGFFSFSSFSVIPPSFRNMFPLCALCALKITFQEKEIKNKT